MNTSVGDIQAVWAHWRGGVTQKMVCKYRIYMTKFGDKDGWSIKREKRIQNFIYITIATILKITEN